MAFHDVHLPDDVERGAQGGPRFKTTVITLSGGREKRNIDWETTRGEWDIGYGIESKIDFEDVIQFFYARQGRAHSFRFKDWADFEVGTPGNPVIFAVGDGATKIFQAKKRYAAGLYQFDRDLTKLVAGTVEIYVNGVLKTSPTNYTLDLLTGLITFVVTPPLAEPIAIAAEFDVPVRFSQDALDVTMETFDAGTISNVPVIEVKGE